VRAYTGGYFRLHVVRKPAPPVTDGAANGLPKGSMESPTGDWDPAEGPGAADTNPIGATTDWTYMMGSQARWNPCGVIRWGYNATGGYTNGLADMKRAFARVAGRTGLHFKYVGIVNFDAFVANYDNFNNLPEEPDIAVGWRDAATEPHLAGGVVGVGHATSWGSVIRNGYVVMDRQGALRSGFDKTGYTTWGQVMQHEVLHVLGLGHSRTDTQIMSSVATVHVFGRGDITGMTKIGATQGCL
jgi:hypothetical protein